MGSTMRVLQQCFRVYAEQEAFEASIKFYEGQQDVPCERRVKIAETGVEVAKVGGVLILAGEKAQLDPIREVGAIFYVDRLDDWCAWLEANGGVILHGPRDVTAGRNLTARHPDGLVAEYFQAG